MQKFSLFRITSISLLIVSLVTFGMLFIASSLIFLYQKNTVEESTSHIKSLLMQIFDENENIADAITTTYTLALQSGACTIPALHKEENFYGFNYSTQTHVNGGDYGTLLTLKPLDTRMRCLVHAAGTVQHLLSQSDLLTKKGFRYLVTDKTKLIYVFGHVDANLYDVSHSKLFHDLSRYIPMIPDYYKRKLTNNIMSKGTVATPLYHDAVTGQTAYSVVGFIYDLNGDGSPATYLLYDHSNPEITGLVRPIISDKPWVSFRIQERSTKQSMCLSDRCATRKPWLTSESASDLSTTFQLVSEINVLKSIYAFPFVNVVLFALLLLGALLHNILKRILLSSLASSFIDPLTGLYTRKVLSVIKQQKNRPGYVAMIDCNKFKEINDVFGHNAGDQVLVYIGQTIKNELRKQDFAIRYGGDEFLIVVFVDDYTKAQNVLKRIQNRIGEKIFTFGEQTFTPAISWGIASLGNDLRHSIQQADERMYAMKKATHAESR